MATPSNVNHSPAVTTLTALPDQIQAVSPQPAKQTHQGRKTERVCNVLSSQQNFRLWNELVAAQGELEAEHCSLLEAADRMAQRLGFAVTKSAVSTAVEQGIVTWDRKKPAKERSNKSGSSYIKERVIKLEEAVAAMQDLLCRICAELGVKHS